MPKRHTKQGMCAKGAYRGAEAQVGYETARRAQIGEVVLAGAEASWRANNQDVSVGELLPFYRMGAMFHGNA